jgi:hypothetical protein
MATKPTDLKPGDRVTYADVNLRDNRGVVVAVQRGPRGGDCVVHWTRPLDVTSEECAFNLKVIR